MIWMAREDRKRAVNLLGQHRAHEQMRPRLRAKRETAPWANSREGCKTIRSADHQNEILRSGIPERTDHFREIL